MRCAETGCGDGSDGKLKSEVWYSLNDDGEFDMSVTPYQAQMLFQAAIREGYRKEKRFREFPFNAVEDLIDELEADELKGGTAIEDLQRIQEDSQAKEVKGGKKKGNS